MDPVTRSVFFVCLAILLSAAVIDSPRNSVLENPVVISFELSEKIVYDELGVAHRELVVRNLVLPIMPSDFLVDISSSMPSSFHMDVSTSSMASFEASSPTR